MNLAQYTVIYELKYKFNHHLNCVKISGENREYFKINVKFVKYSANIPQIQNMGSYYSYSHYSYFPGNRDYL